MLPDGLLILPVIPDRIMASPILMPEDDWYNVDVITCAAPNLREKPSNMYNNGDGVKKVKVSDKELIAIHEKRLGRILDVAVAKGDETVMNKVLLKWHTLMERIVGL